MSLRYTKHRSRNSYSIFACADKRFAPGLAAQQVGTMRLVQRGMVSPRTVLHFPSMIGPAPCVAALQSSRSQARIRLHTPDAHFDLSLDPLMWAPRANSYETVAVGVKLMSGANVSPLRLPC